MMGSYIPADEEDGQTPDEETQRQYLEFLRDGGLDLLHAFRQIKDEKKRAEVLQLAQKYGKISQN